ncbi:RNA-guided endonuclease TnpB family protein, partial [Plantactinospora sp. ZYX-F-223]|uniref:RNA-guided endonuclease InsQ/TnpB family protein n=1 Tax=Plantactinospora sp. ZYX-F-223 TaxID=3144103 RepID=UPI0031FD1349
MLTAWKKTEELAFLNEVSSVPLQQALRHLQGAFVNFFAKRARYPSFKSKKKSRKSAEYTTSAFRWRDGRLTLAKMAEPLDILWSRPLPEGASPSTVTVSQDAAGRWFVTVRNMVKNRPLARAISDAAWRQFRTMLEYKADWHGRDLVVVDRWFPSSKLCSTCGVLAERMLLDVRTWTCRCGTIHDRDVNAARNILAEGLSVTACGAGVRPQRADARTRRSVLKQENPRATKGIPAL